MLKRLLFQMCALVLAGVAAGFISNASRSSLRWSGGDPEIIGRDVEALSAQEASQLLDDSSTLFLDVRPQRDFEAAHVRGAVSFSSDDFGAAYDRLRDFTSPDMKLVVYGDKTLLAVRAAEFLKARGLRPIVLEGGWRAWRERRLPMEEGASP